MTTSTDPYVSRTSPDWELTERQDPVIWPKEDGGVVSGALDASRLRAFDEQGFLFVPSLFSEAECEEIIRESERVAASLPRTDESVIREPGSKRVRSLFRLHARSPVLRALCADDRLVRVASQILGGPVYVHQSRVNFKAAFDGREFFWHSDFETWHVEDGMPRMRALSASVFLTESHEFNGPLMVVPGSHRRYVRCAGGTPEDHYRQSLRRQEYGVPSRPALEALVEEGGIEAPKGVSGSVLFFDCNVMHGSGPNLSPGPRTNAFVVFNSVQNRLVEPFGEHTPRPEFLAEREPRAILGA